MWYPPTIPLCPGNSKRRTMHIEKPIRAEYTPHGSQM
jgi:hypothetical protein